MTQKPPLPNLDQIVDAVLLAEGKRPERDDDERLKCERGAQRLWFVIRTGMLPSGRHITDSPQATAREREVAELVMEGLTAIQIAARLEISYDTVRDHMKSIRQKTGANQTWKAAMIILAERGGE